MDFNLYMGIDGGNVTGGGNQQAAYLIGPFVNMGRQELVDEVAVGGV